MANPRKYKRRTTRTQPPKRNNRNTFIVLGLAIVLAVAGLVWYNAAGRTIHPELRERVETYPSEGQAHIAIGEKASYETDPPQSGAHYAQVAPTGFYERSVPDEVLVHNLEHGHIIAFFDPDRLSSEDEAYLTTLTQSYTGQWGAFLAVPRAGMDHPFILSAWRHLLRLEALDRELVDAFIDAYRGRGPENPIR